jgi:hypothetical protein
VVPTSSVRVHSTPAANGPSRGFQLAIAAGIVGLVVAFGAVSYGVGGYLIASNRISRATGVINAVDSHRASINTSFDDIQQLLSSHTVVTASAAKSEAADFVSRSQQLASPITGYAPALHSAQLKLNDLAWLTASSRGSLQDESARLDHASKAIADVETAANDYRLLGTFLESYFQVFVDLDNMDAASKNNDGAGYATAFLLLRSDVATALQLAILPYLSTAHHDQLTAIQAEINDIKQEQLAAANGDQAGLAAATKAYDADVQKVNAVDFSSNPAAIQSHYQHYRDDFNAEMDKATA